MSANQKSEAVESLATHKDEAPEVMAPTGWKLRRVVLALRIPLVVLLAIVGWIYVPLIQARKEQNALAAEYFAQCAKTLQDTAALPKVPDEALQDAINKRSLTLTALQSWSPRVWSEIRDKQWVAHIQFSPPTGYAVEKSLGPVLAEAGYDTPSPGQ